MLLWLLLRVGLPNCWAGERSRNRTPVGDCFGCVESRRFRLLVSFFLGEQLQYILLLCCACEQRERERYIYLGLEVIVFDEFVFFDEDE